MLSNSFTEFLFSFSSKHLCSDSNDPSNFPGRFILLDSDILALSFSQFYLALIAIQRRNFSTGIAYISESHSPDRTGSILNDSRVAYALKALRSRKILSRLSRNTFSVHSTSSNKIKISYVLFSNILSVLTESNYVFIKCLLLFISNQSLSINEIQSVLHVRKQTSCLLKNSISVAFKSLLELLSSEISLTKDLYASRKHIHITIDHSSVTTNPESVPFSHKEVPNSSIKRVFLNNNNLSKPTKSNRDYCINPWVFKMSDRFFSSLNNLNRIPEELFDIPNDNSLVTSEPMSFFLSKKDFSVIVALTTLTSQQTFFKSISNDKLFKIITEIYLNLKSKIDHLKINNTRAYVFKSIRNFINDGINEYPLTDMLRKKSSSQVRLEFIDHNKLYYDKLKEEENEEILTQFELATGRKYDPDKIFFDQEFMSFSRTFIAEKELNKSQINSSELTEKYLKDPAAFDDRKSNDSTRGKTMNSDAPTRDYLPVNSRFKFLSQPISALKDCLCEMNIISDSKFSDDYHNRLSRNDITLKLFKKRFISSDEYVSTPSHIRKMLVEEVSTSGEVVYRLI